ncbi:MAG: hypothetical protein OYL97_19380 [Candidatus Poribacteria bacterium]|nr:hypothetical protein [Candidatus Poribacteria bacterium]
MIVDFSNILSSTADVQVQAHWEPIADATYNLHQPTREQFDRLKARLPEPVNMEWEQALELFNLKPVHPLKNYSQVDFQVFLPPSAANVGDIWELDPKGILPFLCQFHPGATTEITIFSHRTPKSDGARACLRAISPDYAEVVFRIHAQFVLDAFGIRLLPSQFAGRLVLNRKEGEVVEFSLFLPSRNSNVDVNVFRAADIAFIPRMELSTLSSTPVREIAWETAITEEEAHKTLATAFYKFAKIEWGPIEDAVELAKSTNRPIHALVLFGALADESC